MASGGNDVASDEISDFKCVTCSNTVVVKSCVECQGYCCQFCVDTHSRFPTLKGHTLFDPSSLERCLIHTFKLVDMYCKKHDDVGCTICMDLNHRSCGLIHSIPDDIDVLYKATDVEDTNRYLQSSEKLFKSIEMKEKEALADLNSSRKKADMTIDNAKQEIIVRVENLAKKSKQEVEKRFQTTKAQIEKKKEKMDDLQRMSTDLKKSEGDKAQQFVCMKIANRKIKAEEEIEQALQYNEEANISFDVDTSIQTFLHNIKTFGRVSYTRGSKRYSVEAITDMNVNVPGDMSRCHIVDSCLLEDRRLLLVDRSNKKLKRVNCETKTVDDDCRLDNHPMCVCCTSKIEAVVAFYTSANFIQFVFIGPQLTPSRKVVINHHCIGISYKDGNLYMTDNAQTIYIHDLAGNELQRVLTDGSGNYMFSCVQDTFLSEYMCGCIVTDLNKGVIMLNDRFQRIAGYCDVGLQGASSACTDGRGSIFVCGCNSHVVLQIGYDGKKIGDIGDSSNGIKSPLSLCFDSTTNRLIVTQGGSDIIKIIQLKF